VVQVSPICLVGLSGTPVSTWTEPPVPPPIPPLASGMRASPPPPHATPTARSATASPKTAELLGREEATTIDKPFA